MKLTDQDLEIVRLRVDRDMLRDALMALVKSAEEVIKDHPRVQYWHALEGARQALAQAGGQVSAP